MVFGRPIGQNHGVQFPIAENFIEIEAADLMRFEACRLYGRPEPCGAGFASEDDVERKFRETRLYQVAPISTNLILSYVAEHILDLPPSFQHLYRRH